MMVKKLENLQKEQQEAELLALNIISKKVLRGRIFHKENLR